MRWLANSYKQKVRRSATFDLFQIKKTLLWNFLMTHRDINAWFNKGQVSGIDTIKTKSCQPPTSHKKKITVSGMTNLTNSGTNSGQNVTNCKQCIKIDFLVGKKMLLSNGEPSDSSYNGSQLWTVAGYGKYIFQVPIVLLEMQICIELVTITG